MLTLDNLKSFDNLIEDELQLYEKLKDFYTEKKKILIASKVKDLLLIDDEILRLVDEIKSAVNHRRIFSKKLDKPDICLSELETEAVVVDMDLASEFKTKQIRVKELFDEIKRQERSSQELIKHGINMVTKTLNLVADRVSPPVAGEYNSSGKNPNNEFLQMSSVSEEV